MTHASHDDDRPGHPDADAHHDPEDHGDTHGHDDHAHPDGPLGPIDVSAWGAGAVGVALGLVMTLCFVIAVGALG